MKETRFIELINLYIDRQISAEEVAELEAEIQASPKHRKVYQQYCHMHRATKLVYESFRANAEHAAGETSEAGCSIAQFENTRRRTQRLRRVYSAAGLAAAACFAVVVMHNNRAPADAGATVAALPAPTTVVAAVAPVDQAAQPVPVAVVAAPETPAAIAVEQKYASILSVMRQEEIRALALRQQMIAQPSSLFAEDMFDNSQTLSVDGQKLYPLKPKKDKKAAQEFTAFQFQR